jgi:hypothetical protein
MNSKHWKAVMMTEAQFVPSQPANSIDRSLHRGRNSQERKNDLVNTNTVHNQNRAKTKVNNRHINPKSHLTFQSSVM